MRNYANRFLIRAVNTAHCVARYAAAWDINNNDETVENEPISGGSYVESEWQEDGPKIMALLHENITAENSSWRIVVQHKMLGAQTTAVAAQNRSND